MGKGPTVTVKTYGRYNLRSGRKIDKIGKTRLYTRMSRLHGMRLRPLRRVLPVLPPIQSIGIMDIGQGNCNLLFDQTNTPVTYYDFGYPNHFNYRSAPLSLKFGDPAFLGPILPSAANGINIVLSHWDFDHYGLGYIYGLDNIPWTVPDDGVGPWTRDFCARLEANNMLTRVTTPVHYAINYTIFRCVPTPGTAPIALRNNRGIAMRIATNLPSTDATIHRVLLTADANFDTVPPAARQNLTGILAAHHGSGLHGAPDHLPVQANNYNNQGRVAFSYGIKNGVYCYGHPRPDAVQKYIDAGWNRQCSTAEGVNVRTDPTQANRGNIRMGINTPLGPGFQNTAFTNFPNQLD
ncbi:MAG: hypothetical protein QNK23_13845 [Crocinitomicaceae bacterium]|nr:hypothetical protein [Crocinitomicaceae bacterium]